MSIRQSQGSSELDSYTAPKSNVVGGPSEYHARQRASLPRVILATADFAAPAIVLLLCARADWLKRTVIFSDVTRMRPVLAALATLLLLAHVALRLRRRHSVPRLLRVSSLVLLLVSAVVVLPENALQRFSGRPGRTLATGLLRLAALQEDARLSTGSYSAHFTAADVGLPDSRLVVRTDGSRSWSGTAAAEGERISCVYGAAPQSPASADFHASGPDCGESEASGSHAGAGARGSICPVPEQAPARTGATAGEWLQFRRDPVRSGGLESPSPEYEWCVGTGLQFRSSPTAVEDMVVIGAHGTGELQALDAQSGRLIWRNRAPNWIHNDALISQHLVVVGFGNNFSQPPRGITGTEPTGGVAAFDRQTGRRVWTVAAGSTVMTSPAIVRDMVVFGTGNAEAIGVDLASGAVRWRTALPGSVIMASPAVDGGVVYFTNGERSICALDARSGARNWCSHLPGGMDAVRESSPSVGPRLLYVSAIYDSSRADVIRRNPVDYFRRSAALRWLTHLTPGNRFADQRMYALSREDGRIMWERSLGSGHLAFGHASGTAVVADDRLFVSSPIGQAVLALSAESGAVLWKRPMPAQLRGPVMLLDSAVVVADRAGTVSLLRQSDGGLACSMKLDAGFDRAGPARVGRTAYFASMHGNVLAVPISRLARCEPSVAR